MTGRRSCWTIAAFAALAACTLDAGSAAARDWTRAPMEQQVKGCSVTVFVDPEFKGPSWTTTNGWAAVGWEFNDRISSIRVHAGIWRFYRDDNFVSQVETLYPGSYKELHPTADNVISSFKCEKAT
jgi:hypothetical protein